MFNFNIWAHKNALICFRSWLLLKQDEMEFERVWKNDKACRQGTKTAKKKKKRPGEEYEFEL